MPKSNTPILAFNRGVISPLALARVDLERLQLSAEIQTNWMPRVLGSMMLRPGFGYIYGIRDNSVNRNIPFIGATDDTAILELTGLGMRVSVDETIITRPAVTATISNGLFTNDLANWTDADESGASSAWHVGRLGLLGTGTNEASRTQLITLVEASTVHALAIEIIRGPVQVRIGSTAVNGSYHDAILKTGNHSLAFTPTGNFYINFSSALDYTTYVGGVVMESAGAMVIPAPWTGPTLGDLRATQSADVIFVAADGYQQRRIERRDNDSWSVVLYEPLLGPFGNLNIGPITITASALVGEVTLTASRSLFTGLTTEHSGTLFRITSNGQIVQADITAQDTFTTSVLITGVGNGRDFSVSIAGTWSATVTLQRSTDDATWEDVETYTANTTATFTDGLDNVALYYRIGVKTGDFTSGTARLGLTFSGGSLTGIVKIRTVASPTSAGASVIVPLGGTAATANWYEGEWDTAKGFPTAMSLYEGRMFNAGRGKVWGSVSDGFSNFNDDVIGDSAPINRNIGQGPVDKIVWLAPLDRLILGTAGAEVSARSTSFEEPLTSGNFNLKDSSTQGAANVDMFKIDKAAVYVQRSGSRVYRLQYNVSASGTGSYVTVDLSELAPEITEPSIVRLAVQRQPDTRVHCVRSDGKVAVLVTDPAEKTLAWILVETDGFVEDAFVLPGTIEDKVYYSIKRTVNGATVRYLERWALESEGRGGVTNKLADSFIYYSGESLTTITGLTHLEGETVILWGNGKDLSTYTVSSGSITPSEPVTSYCVGLGYTADFKSSKLAYAAGMGTALTQTKKVNQIGIIARDIHRDGLMIGPNFTDLSDMPRSLNHQIIPDDTVSVERDDATFPFGGHWDTDSRLCMRAQAPKPVTVLAAIVGLQTNDKA